MRQQLSTPTTLRRVRTWRSGPESPEVPDANEADELVATVAGSVDRDCVVVRLQLSSSRVTLHLRVREWLREADAVVGTSIGRGVGPVEPDSFDIVVEPGYDPATVGRPLADVEQVVAVSAATFETTPVAGRPHKAADVGSQAAIDDAFAELREEVGWPMRGTGRVGGCSTTRER